MRCPGASGTPYFGAWNGESLRNPPGSGRTIASFYGYDEIKIRVAMFHIADETAGAILSRMKAERGVRISIRVIGRSPACSTIPSNVEA